MLPAVEVKEKRRRGRHRGAIAPTSLAERNVLHLIYAGFATNWLPASGADYGHPAHGRGRGYNIIAPPRVYDGRGVSGHARQPLCDRKSAYGEIEQQFGFTASNQDFVGRLQVCVRRRQSCVVAR